jgi:hypothetical protein
VTCSSHALVVISVTFASTTTRRAADSARRIGARAYAYGDQVVFGVGEFAPDSDAGRRLLAHELTHVLQEKEGEQRIRRAPEDVTRLNQLPLSAHRSRPHFTIAFYTVYAEATGDLPDFKARVKSACAESSEGLNLDAGNQGAVNAAADEMAELTDGLTVGGAYQPFDLAGAVKKLYELMPSVPGDIQVTNFGFEYIYGRLVSHSADFVALSLQEHAHGPDIDADPDLSAVAGSSDTAFVQLSQDLARIVAALSDGKSLLMLELEGLVSTLVDLRNQFDPRASRDEQAENYRMRSELARRALLVNDKLMKMNDDPTAPTPLDTSVEKTLSEIRRTARSEEDTRTALGDTKSLLAAQPLNMADRVDDPFFKESGLSEEAEGAEIKPQVAFPKTTEGFAAEAQHDLADRINRQSKGLQEQLAQIVPPHEESKYNLPEFAKVHKHWFSLFGIEAEKAMIQQAGALDLWHGIHQATAIGTLSVSGDMMTAWLRYETMKQTMGLLGLFVGTGVEREFGSVIAQQTMRRKAGAFRNRCQRCAIRVRGALRQRVLPDHGRRGGPPAARSPQKAPRPVRPSSRVPQACRPSCRRRLPTSRGLPRHRCRCWDCARSRPRKVGAIWSKFPITSREKPSPTSRRRPRPRSRITCWRSASTPRPSRARIRPW